MEAPEKEGVEEDPGTEAHPVCECCLEPVPKDYALFCPKCGAPIDPLAAYLPFERIFAQGYLFRQAAEHPTRLITVIGIWIIFLVPAVMLIIGRIGSLGSETAGWGDWLLFILIVGLYLGISLRVTRNYLLRRKTAPGKAKDPPIEGPPQ